MDILVIGAGVSGLTTGVRLLQAGHSVTIWAKSFPPATTSNVAAAVWYPYKAHPADKVTAWGGEAFQAFKQLRSVEAAGIMMAEVVELKSVTSPDPWWAAAVDGFRHAHPEELPPGYADGYVFAAPVIDMSIYLVYLVRQFESLGGTLVQHTLTDLGEAFARSAAVVNCSGLGARELVGDRDIRPSRGQVLRIAHTGFRRVLLDDDGPNQVAYIVPRINDIVIGGTDIEGSESTDIDPTQSADILRRCARLVAHYDPTLAASLAAHAEGNEGAASGVSILGAACGLRPVRSTVRVEIERPTPDRCLIHNYGHGGAGVTLSWGCASEVVRLVEACAE